MERISSTYQPAVPKVAIHPLGCAALAGSNSGLRERASGLLRKAEARDPAA